MGLPSSRGWTLLQLVCRDKWHESLDSSNEVLDRLDLGDTDGTSDQHDDLDRVLGPFASSVKATKGELELVDKVEIEDEEVTLGGTFLLIEPISDSDSGWLVDGAEYIEAGANTGILGGLMLRVFKLGRYSHHSILQVMTQIGLSSFLLLLQKNINPGMEKQVIRGLSWPG